MNRRILFVDDEPNLLAGLQRNLRSMRAQWDMEFVLSGDSALEAMAQNPFDVVVTDMRMPGMTGDELLNKIQNRFPRTIRIILSGQSDRRSILKSIAPAHQFLAKPCDTEQLKSRLVQAVVLTELLEISELKTFISRLTFIPSLPWLYDAVRRELNAADPSAARIGRIVKQDMGMTAKILQLVNSAMYGLPKEISEPEQAVQFLGLDTIQALRISPGIFSPLDPETMAALDAEQLWGDSVRVSKFCLAIAHAEGIRGHDADAYVSAGLLHDVGKLIMASPDPERYQRMVYRAATTHQDQCLLEEETMGCNHAKLGAYLLGIWGLPASIVEALAWHHHPSRSAVTGFCPLVAVHVADFLHAQNATDGQAGKPVLDEAFLSSIGLAGRLPVWRESCSEMPQLEKCR